MKAILEVSNLSKNFGGLQAIDNLEFSLSEGDIIGLIGPNGAGKTTLFNLISGIYRPDAGRIILRDEDLINCEPHEICKKGIARTFQLMRPFSHLTVLENVVAGALNRTKKVQKAKRQAHLNISERKCLELAKALATEPKLLLLDEVMAGLNPKEQENFIQLIQRVRGFGITLFIIEHAMKIIMALANHIIVLNYGKKIAEGTPKEISTNKLVIEAYLGKGDRRPASSRPAEPPLHLRAEGLGEVQLKVDKIDVFYGDMQALHNLSLEIRRGEIIALIGANGAGKSTAIKAITGLLPPASGAIEFLGKRIDSLPPHRIVEMGLAQVPEERKIFPNLTVQENLELGSYIKEAKRKRSASIKKVLDLFPALKDRIYKKAATLSGGEQQMLAIGQGLMCCPKLLIFDEPSLGLAPLMVQAIFEAMTEINAQGTTILLVEQNVYYSLSLCDRGYVLENGRIVLEGTGSTLLVKDYIKKAYLGK
jgi:ABC-type branched-subunit amino acid transport system ATPase component